MKLGSIWRNFRNRFTGRGESKQFTFDEAPGTFDPFPEQVIVEFTDVLDLHSIPPNQVSAVVKDYLDEAHRRGLRWLRIIHGKGVGVQREMVRKILESTSFVTDFGDAPAEAGGWGATVVCLNCDPSDEARSR